MDGISEDMMNDMKRIGKKSFRIFLKPDPGQEEVGEVRDLKAGFVGGTKRIVFWCFHEEVQKSIHFVFEQRKSYIHNNTSTFKHAAKRMTITV